MMNYANSLVAMLPKFIIKAKMQNKELTLHIRREYIKEVCTFLRDHVSCQYKQCIEIAGVDYPTRVNRFEVVYCLLSVRYSARIRLVVEVSDLDVVESVSSVYNGANWYEREAWDMYGIFFNNHPDLRRLLTDYGFQGHPLRKDFPMTGYYEIRYDDEEKRIISEPIKLTQEMRMFDFTSPWEQF